MDDRYTWARLLLLGWVAVLTIACPSAAPPSADAGPVDTAPSPEQEACEAAKEPCRSFVWQAGQCVPKVLVGAVCGEVAGACTVGVCDEAGECTGKQPAAVGKVCAALPYTPCKKTLGHCDKSGGCVAEVLAGAKCKAGDDLCRDGLCAAESPCKTSAAGTPCTQMPTNPCQKSTGVCSEAGLCLLEPKVGAECSTNASACGKGTCDAMGQCKSSAAGSACTPTSKTSCQKDIGVCSEDGACVPVPMIGVACLAYWGTCGKGNCDAEGKCKVPGPEQPCVASYNSCLVGTCNGTGDCKTSPLPAGSPCSLAVGSCQVATCNVNGTCTAQPLPEGASCTVAAPKTCESTSGKCDSANKCVAIPAVGSACKGGGSACATGTCNAQGGCDAKDVAPAGTPCTSSPQCGTATCDGKGGCTGDPAKVGKDCGSSNGLACAKYTCNAAGQCALAPNPGANCFAVGDPDKATCHSANLCMGGVCGDAIGKCELKALVGKACPWASECTKGECSAAGNCEQTPVADGTVCSLGAIDPACGSAVCIAGKCIVTTNAGKSCGSVQLCKAGVCSDKGVCEYQPTPGKECGAQGPCGGKVCDATGQCKETIKEGPCDLGPCINATCGADGKCSAQGIKVGATCKDSALCGEGVCNAQGQCVSPAYPKASECHVSTSSVLGECWAGVVSASGACTKVARVGAACGCWVSPCSTGTCQTDGTCLLKPSKPAGTPCSSDCVTDGVCTSAGKCSGKALVGKICNDAEVLKTSYRCRTPRCQEDGNCAQEFVKAGISCQDLYPWMQKGCGQLDKCDGQGHCIVKDPALDGTACGTGDTQCSDGGTCFEGHCLSTGSKPNTTICSMGCASGHCEEGWCKTKWANANLSCSDGKYCTKDTCCIDAFSDGYCIGENPGTCIHTIDKLTCFEGLCWVGMCDQPTGQCISKNISGPSCGEDACGFEYKCFAGGCVQTTTNDKCYDWNPCTLDKCTDCGCSYAPDPAAEGTTCTKGGHCSKGNCVPD